MDALTILLSSSDASLVSAIEDVISEIDGLTLEVCPRLEEVGGRVQRGGVGLVLLHLTTPAEATAAAGLVRCLKARHRPTPSLILNDSDDPRQELALLRLGVTDYLTRPLDLGRLALLIDTHTVEARLTRAREGAGECPVEALGEDDPFLFSPAAAMGRLMEQVRRVAPRSTTLLLGGETGTGKTRLARLIHELSPRRHEPFLTVNCGSLSATLIESEMFGHVRGAFTGADRDRTGKFAEVGRGTLLLDDIDALPLPLQAKLLRVVDERVFEPVGTNQSQPLHARLIVASNRSLEQEVEAGRFRSDLYYRLNVVAFHLPPLRERPEVVPHLARKFVADFAASAGRAIGDVTPAAIRALQAHSWPGNVRELRNVIERAVALCSGDRIDVDDLPDAIRTLAAPRRPAEALPLGATLARSKEEAEMLCIVEALQRFSNNRLRAAAALGISRMTLYKKLRKYGLMGTV